MATAKRRRVEPTENELAVHPIAALFPMLPEDELAELAADIKTRGQLQPIILDGEGCILDGRNRLAACKLAGVEPFFDTYRGDDPKGYALSVNVNRRHLSAGQRAMATALTYPAPEQGKRSTSLKIKEVDINAGSLSQARTVLRLAPELATEVMAGNSSLGEAYQKAGNFDGAVKTEKRRLTELRNSRPELAEAVIAGWFDMARGCNQAGEGRGHHTQATTLGRNKQSNRLHSDGRFTA